MPAAFSWSWAFNASNNVTPAATIYLLTDSTNAMFWGGSLLGGIASAFAVSLPVYYFVELRVLRMKLKFSSEKEVLDLNTGKMMSVEEARAAGRGIVSADAVEGPAERRAHADDAAGTDDTGPERG